MLSKGVTSGFQGDLVGLATGSLRWCIVNLQWVQAELESSPKRGHFSLKGIPNVGAGLLEIFAS
jgi:hypothetical protein